jgi:hypothetical protein
VSQVDNRAAHVRQAVATMLPSVAKNGASTGRRVSDKVAGERQPIAVGWRTRMG